MTREVWTWLIGAAVVVGCVLGFAWILEHPEQVGKRSLVEASVSCKALGAIEIPSVLKGASQLLYTRYVDARCGVSNRVRFTVGFSTKPWQMFLDEPEDTSFMVKYLNKNILCNKVRKTVVEDFVAWFDRLWASDPRNLAAYDPFAYEDCRLL